MNYHVNRDGQELGQFPLDELRRKHGNGEFSGNDLVWCEGMADWQTLDLVLLQNPPPKMTAPPPIPQYSPKSHKAPVWIIVGGVALFAVVVGLVAVRVVQVAKKAVVQRTSLLPVGRTRNTAAMRAASAPVAVSDKSVTEEQVRVKRRAFRERHYLQGYKERGDRHPETDADCIKFLEAWLEKQYGSESTNAAAQSEIVSELADKLVASSNCTDGLVLVLTAGESPELHEAERRLERAMKAFENSKHKAYPRFYSVVSFSRYLNSNSPRLPAIDAEGVRYFKAMLSDGSIQPDDQEDIAETLASGWASSFFVRNAPALIAAARDAGPNFEWLGSMLEGRHEIDEAWRARGTGFSDAVSQAGWKEFERHLQVARSELTSAWNLRKDFPLAPAEMMRVALGSSDITEMREWFDKAVAAQLDYPGAWSSMRWGLRSRWYGDEESMLAFGLTALNTHRFDTDVPRKFFDVLNDLSAEEKLRAGDYLFSRPDIWPHLQEMYDGYIKHEAGKPGELGWRSTYINIAYLAGKYDVARKQLEAVNWEPTRRNFDGWHRELSLIPEEVAARTGAVGTKVAQAEEMRRARDFNGALGIYRDLVAGTNADPRAMRFIRDRVMSVSLEQSLKTGDWLRFMPEEKNLIGWCSRHGTFEPANGGLEVHADKLGHMIFSRAIVGWSFEIKGDFDVVSSSSKAFQAGIVFGLPQWEGRDWYAFRIKRNETEGDVVSLSDGWGSNQVLQPVKLNGSSNSFTFHITGSKVTASVNGQEVFHDVPLPQKSTSVAHDLFVGLGAYNDMNETVIRYRNVQIRRIAPQASDNTQAPRSTTRRKTARRSVQP